MGFIWPKNLLLSVAIHGGVALSFSKGLSLYNQSVGGGASDGNGAFLGQLHPDFAHPVRFYTYEASKYRSSPDKRESHNRPRLTRALAKSSNNGAEATEGAGINGISVHYGQTFGSSASLMRESVVEPKFTHDALDAGFEGLLVIDLLVDELGRVTRARLINPTGFGIDDEALLAAQMARYKPAQDLGGRPVASSAELRFEFRAH